MSSRLIRLVDLTRTAKRLDLIALHTNTHCLSRKNCCVPAKGWVTVFWSLTTTCAGRLVVQIAEEPRFRCGLQGEAGGDRWPLQNFSGRAGAQSTRSPQPLVVKASRATLSCFPWGRVDFP